MPLEVSVAIATAVLLVSVIKGAGLNVLASRATALMMAAAGWEAWLSAVGSFRLSAGASPSATEPEPG